MRLERLDYDKMKIFLTYEDLEKRGISTDHTWSDIPVIDDMFQEMISEASEELNFDPVGPVVVEVFSVPSQGLVIIVTKTEDYSEDMDEPFMEWQLEPRQKLTPFFRLDDLEYVIGLAGALLNQGITGGRLYHYEDAYYLIFDKDVMGSLKESGKLSLVYEFAEKADVSIHMVEEYGQEIIKDQAVAQLTSYFR